MLLQWGIAQCNEHHLPGYLEGTTDAGPLYIRHGFMPVATIEMPLDDAGIYQEICFLYLPLDKSDSSLNKFVQSIESTNINDFA